MTRYFYTDPLAAAWMAKHLGMRFQASNGVPLHFEERDGLAWFVPHDFQHVRYDGAYNIHPDSLHLMEPKPKDIVFYSFGVFEHKGEAWDEVKGVIRHNDEGYPYTGNGEVYVLLDGGDSFAISRLRRIIQRNGIAFMWPECEVP